MASRYWVGGTGTWDNSDTTHWSDSTGGAGGQSVPGSSDTVTFDGSSGGGKITLNYSPSVISITGGAHTGTFDTAGNDFTVQTFSYTGSGARTLTLGDSIITVTGSGGTILTFATITSLTMTANTATFDCTYAGSTGTRTLVTGALTEIQCFNVKVSAGTDALAITAASVFKDLNLTGYAGTKSNTTSTIYGSLTINGGTFTAGANALTFASTSPTARTITSSVSLDFPITINGVGGTFNLGANLTMGATRTLTVTNGTFDCVTYVLSAGLVSCGAASIVKLGSATHLLTGTGTVWTGTAGCLLAAGTSTLKINDSSNTTTTFAGGVLSYNNVWFSRGTSTASNTISGNNFYKDFKDDGSIAHSILFTDASTQTFNTFTVSGTAGQLITINGTSTGTHTLNKIGGGTISRDYLNIQHSIALPSGQWYAGANSVNNQAGATAGSGWNFPRFWVGGTGVWDAATTTNWSATSGGAGGATAPTVSDDVTFDLHGNEVTDAAYTVTLTTAANCYNVDVAFTGTTKVTLAGTAAWNIGGNLNFSGGTAQINRTFTGAVNFLSLGSPKTVTMNGIAFATGLVTFNSTTVNSVVGGYTLQDAFSSTAAGITHTAGVLDTNGQTVTCGTFTAGTSTYRVLTLGASTINCSTSWSASTPTNIVFSGGSSTIVVTGANGFDGGGLTYGTVNYLSSGSVTGTNTFANLTISPATPAKTDSFVINNNITITGTFTVSDGATVTNRVLISGPGIGRQITITATAISISNADFRDIKGAGAASWDMSAASGGSGNYGGNSMKALGDSAFTTAVDQHWTNVNDGSWSNSANWTSRVPLPQDDVYLDCSFGTAKTVTADMPVLGKNINWTGATWTTSLTFTGSTNFSCFGSFTLISGITYTANTSGLTLAGRGAYTIDNKTVTIDQPVTVNAPGGTYTMAANLTLNTSRTLTVTQGTFDTSSYVLSTGLLSLVTGANGISATLNLNAGTHLLTGTGTVFSATSLLATSVLNAGTSTLKITDTSATGITVANAKILNNVWFSRGTSTAINTISNSGIFNDFKDDGSVGHTITFTANIVVGVTTFTVTGTSSKVITLLSGTTNFKFTLLAKTGTITCDYMIIRDSLVGGGATWNAGANSIFLPGNYFGTGFGWADAPAAVKNRYWVAGGDGSYNDGSNWSTTSGGTANATPPIGEIVNFDASSGAGTCNIMPTSTSTCGQLDCTGFTGTIAGTGAISVAGSFKLVSGMAGFPYTGNITFGPSGSSETIDFGSKQYLGTLFGCSGVDGFSASLFGIQGYGDTWTLSSDLTCNIISCVFSFSSGSFNANGYNVTTGLFQSNTTNYRQVNLGTGTWLLTGTATVWNIQTSNQMTIIPSSSTIKINNPTSVAKLFAGGGKTHNNLWLTGFGTGAFTFAGSNTFNDIKCDTPPHNLSFTQGTVTSFNTFTVDGTPGNLQTIQSLSDNSPHFLKQVVGSTSSDYLLVSNSKSIGVAYAGTHSVNTDQSLGGVVGNNENWFFTAPSTQLSGTVTLSSVGVSGATVRLIRQDTNEEVGVTTTDGSGDYSFYADSSKKYHVCAEYTTGGVKYNAKSLWELVAV